MKMRVTLTSANPGGKVAGDHKCQFLARDSGEWRQLLNIKKTAPVLTDLAYRGGEKGQGVRFAFALYENKSDPFSLRSVLCGSLHRFLFHMALAIGVVRRFFARKDPLPLQGVQVVLRYLRILIRREP